MLDMCDLLGIGRSVLEQEAVMLQDGRHGGASSQDEQ